MEEGTGAHGSKLHNTSQKIPKGSDVGDQFSEVNIPLVYSIGQHPKIQIQQFFLDFMGDQLMTL
jgi:hypothetical protein